MIKYRSRILFFLFFLLICFFNSFSQTRWTPVGAKWYYNFQELLLFDAFGYTLYENIGDSIINDTLVEIIQKTFYKYNGEVFKKQNKYISYSNGQLSVYESNKFRLIYDFNLKVYDTLRIDVKNPGFCDSVSSIVVDSITCDLYNGYEIKTIHTSYTLYYKEEFSGQSEHLNFNYTERIGNFRRFLYTPECQIEDYFGNTELRCYVDNEIGIVKGYYWDYFHKNESCDTLINDPNTNITIDQCINEIIVFPNPVTDKLYYFMNSNQYNTIQIYNHSGVKLSELSSSPFSSLDMTLYPTGLYFIKFNGKKQIVLKIIKQ